jgi:G2/mitotic-specific cyclin 3/4
MLSMLQFELGWPGPMSFLRRISKADDYDLETRTLAKYFLEITIMDERFVGCSPSFLSAGAHCLARMMLKKGDWVSHVSTPTAQTATFVAVLRFGHYLGG